MEISSLGGESVAICPQCSESQVPGIGKHDKPGNARHKEIVDDDEDDGTGYALSRSENFKSK